MRTLPWVRAAASKYGPHGLTVVGVHTPEFDYEHDREAVRQAAEREGVAAHSHLLDNDGRYWRALGNQYWPTLYLVDRRGNLRYRHIGEAHSGQSSGQALEEQIERLLAEASDDRRAPAPARDPPAE